MPSDEPTDEDRQEELPEDNATPFQPADFSQGDPAASVPQRPTEDNLDDTHPATDSNMEQPELYDEGISGAAEAGEPNAGNAVVGYTPSDSGDQAGSGQSTTDDSTQTGAEGDDGQATAG